MKEEARRREPNNWSLTQTSLTDPGYVKLVLDTARVLSKSRGFAPRIRVLDWGGGPGFFSYLLQSVGMEATYYDFRADCLSYAYVLGLLHGPIRYAEDPIMLPFADGSFDAVVSLGVLEHVAEHTVSLREINRVLSVNGNLFIYHFPNRFGYIETVARRFGGVMDRQASKDDLPSGFRPDRNPRVEEAIHNA